MDGIRQLIARDNAEGIMLSLEQEYKLYIKLAYLSVQLKDVVSNSKDSALIEKIQSDKAYIIEELEKLSGNNKGLMNSTIVNNDNISKLTGKIRGVIIKIIEYERECGEELIKERKNITEKLLKINNSLQSAKTFPKGIKPPSYLSIKL